MAELKYVGYYDTRMNAGEERGYALSAATKMEYICEVLNEAGCSVLVISPSQSRAGKGFPGKTYQYATQTRVKLFRTFGGRGKTSGVLRLLWSQLALLGYLLTHTRRGERVLAYHSLYIQFPLLVAKWLRGITLILEVEELYQDVVRVPKIVRWCEHAVIRSADAYVFASELLNDQLNASGKPQLVLYGSYRTPSVPAGEFEDGLVHVVYAGTLDRRKGNLSFLGAAAHLGSEYHLHVLGFGTDSEVEFAKARIAALQEVSLCRVTYDGVLKGAQFSEFLKKCQVGLATQDPLGRFNATSFPSKVVTYLAHGLRVVTVRIPALERSRLAPDLVLCDSVSGVDVAKAIVQAGAARVGESGIIERLDVEFRRRLPRLLDEVQ